MERKERIKMEWNRIKEWVGVFSFQCVWEFIKGCKKKKKKKFFPHHLIKVTKHSSPPSYGRLRREWAPFHSFLFL